MLYLSADSLEVNIWAINVSLLCLHKFRCRLKSALIYLLPWISRTVLNIAFKMLYIRTFYVSLFLRALSAILFAFPLCQKRYYVQIQFSNHFLGSYTAARNQWTTNIHFRGEQNQNTSKKKKVIWNIKALHTHKLHDASSSNVPQCSYIKLKRCCVGPFDPQGQVEVDTDGVQRTDCADCTLTLCKQWECALNSPTKDHHCLSKSDMAYRDSIWRVWCKPKQYNI